MDPIKKALNKLPPLERAWTDEIFKSLYSGDTKGLDIKKLKGREDVFRARKGDVRVIYHKNKDGGMTILAVGRRNESTYSL